MTPKTKDDIIEGYESTRVNTDYERYEDMWDKESIKQMMEEYLRQSSCGMRWIKASEKIPCDGDYYCRCLHNSEVMLKKVATLTDGVFLELIYEDGYGHADIEWLDESPESYCSLCMKYREALEKIDNPIKYLQDEAEKEGAKLNGGMTIQLANDANFLRTIASDALK